MKRVVVVFPHGNVVTNSIEDDSIRHNQLLQESNAVINNVEDNSNIHNQLLQESFEDFLNSLTCEEKKFECDLTVWPNAFYIAKLLEGIVVLDDYWKEEDSWSHVFILPSRVTQIEESIVESIYKEKHGTFLLITQESETYFQTFGNTFQSYEEMKKFLNDERKGMVK